MEIKLLPFTKNEGMYAFMQSSQIAAQCGLIGYLHADLGGDGIFLSGWQDWRKDLKTEEFKEKFDEIIEELRNGVLKNEDALKTYCNENPQAIIRDRQYGFRVDTEKTAHIFRLIPEKTKGKSEYNVICFCYRLDWFEDHLKQAERGIRFITPNYDALFKVADGDKVRISYPDGEEYERVCRYIDDYHVEIGDNLYHICEFAELMAKRNARVTPVSKPKLPGVITHEVCFFNRQSAEDLFKDVQTGRVYVRQPASSKGDDNHYTSVQWLTSSKWSGGYEASCPISASVKFIVVTKDGKKLYEECGSSKAMFPFSYEVTKDVAESFAEINNLRPYDEWHKWIIDGKPQGVETDNWIYGELEELDVVKIPVERFANKNIVPVYNEKVGYLQYLGGKFFVEIRKLKHSTGKVYKAYELVDNDGIVLEICGYEFKEGRGHKK